MTDFDIEAFHRRAVETPSHESVAAMREVLVKALREHGADPTVDEAGNVLASRGGRSDGGHHIVLNTHIDTVPPHVPYERKSEGEGEDGGGTEGEDGEERIYGRGACDAKGPLAALLAAFLRADPTDGTVTLAITPDEETVQSGAAHLANTLSADAYIVGEPTGLDVCTAARGQFEGTITIRGESAHAATPGEGANAIRAAAPVLQAMETYDEREARSASERASGDGPEPRARGPGEHDLLGRPTLTPTLVEGGEVVNQVPGECVITFDRRPVPPETAAEFRAGLEEHLYQWMPTGMDLRVELAERETPFLEAFATDADEAVVQALQRASGGEIRPFGAATEASYFAANAPTVVFGPGVLADAEGAVAHSEREYVPRESLHRAADAVADALAELV